MSIPEFILRKMLVPDSYKYKHGQFNFLIMNNYAPGTITALKLIADDVEIPLNHVTIQVQGHSPTLASKISLTNPARLPTNIRISITGIITPPPTQLVLYAETKEVGVIRFHVRDKSKRKCRRSRLLSLLRTPLKIGLNIDLQKSIPISICGSGFSSDVYTRHSSIMQGTQKLHFVPRDSCITLRPDKRRLLRPYVLFRVDPFTLSSADGRSDLDAYLDFCLSSCTPPILEVDANKTGAVKLMEWIAQCHANLDRVNYWLIQGNAWQPWELAQENAIIYAKKVKRLAQAIRLRYPAATIGMVCKHSLPGDGDDLKLLWNKAAFSEVGTNIDFVHWQVPHQEAGFRHAEHTSVESLKATLGYPEKLGNGIDQVRDQLSACIPNSTVLQSIDMTIPFRFDAKKNPNLITRSDSVVRDLLELQAFMTVLANHEDIAFAAIGVSNRLIDDSDFRLASSGENVTSAYEIQLVPVSYSQTYTSKTKDTSPNGSSKYVNAFAVYAPDLNCMHVTLVNLYPDRRLQVTLTYPEIRPSEYPELSTAPPDTLSTHVESLPLTNSRKVVLRPHSVAHLSVRMRDN